MLQTQKKIDDDAAANRQVVQNTTATRQDVSETKSNVDRLVEAAKTTDDSGNPIGLLLPANDPLPSMVENYISTSIGSSNEVFLIFGNNCVVLERKDSVSLVRFHEHVLVRLNSGSSGAFVSGQFFDKNENIFALMETNRFVLDRANFWRVSRPDKSTLIIINHQNKEALNIRFCRPNVFKILGIFCFPDGTEATVTENGVRFNYFQIGGCIFSGAGGIFINSNGSFGCGDVAK